ncbi:PREDICTED: glucosamine 6-phosphate N-acetyltransferase isoform X1 [Vollenhovia emeryi]|uniref:glucosamine 6-phosphate N-acetyltransferase isoform X1 n=1 Tax=Vollenhovia emeryi TaxID=411798 RepID=UPI0005F44911|nr:PREDICTED: glucosamine 6-phosphate N-acetyltransferase isoform X1 [Vollenhovia emeryi]
MNRAQGKSVEEDDANLFNPTILDRLPISHVAGLLIRPLKSTDYDKGFLVLLSQLTDVGNVTKEQFLNRFYSMKAAGGYYVVVIEDVNSGKVIACASLVVEQKFIHNCSLVHNSHKALSGDYLRLSSRCKGIHDAECTVMDRFAREDVICFSTLADRRIVNERRNNNSPLAKRFIAGQCVLWYTLVLCSWRCRNGIIPY